VTREAIDSRLSRPHKRKPGNAPDPHLTLCGLKLLVATRLSAPAARVLFTLIYEMICRHPRRGIAALRLGGGNP